MIMAFCFCLPVDSFYETKRRLVHLYRLFKSVMLAHNIANLIHDLECVFRYLHTFIALESLTFPSTKLSRS